MIGVGTDIIEISRIEKATKETTSFMKKVFTPRECAYFETINSRIETLAGGFAAKEAVSKALGTGFRKITMQEIEIKRDTLGKPYVVLYGAAEARLEELGGSQIEISISHCKTYAVAFCVIM